MRTHKGNVGAIVADIGEVTIETLKRFSIPYDELYFGKPYANFYIDDLAVNPYVSLHESTGLYNTTTKSRIFNDVNFTETKVTKISNNSGEPYYYNNIPERVKHLFPVIHSIEDNTITMENIDGVSYSHLLINEQLKENDIDLLMTTINKLHEIKSSTNFSDMYSVYASKLKARYVEHQKLYNDLKLNDTYNKLLKDLTTYENNNEGIKCVIHGDPVFTNVIKTESGIKFIDMRGKTIKNTIYGDLHYDYAKIHQSLMGYDFILNNIEINDNYLSGLRNCFFRKCNVKNINLLTASLYFSLLPLHEYDKDKFDRYINIIEDLT
jgi:tRNA A-37 threonylcarbamoyl transferase component Bud32